MLNLQLFIASAVLVTNAVITIVGWRKFSGSNNVGTIYTGNCATVEQLELWTHLIINGLATLLLGASNYCMQILVSPTRKNLDEAHARKISLAIGVQSIRNLFYLDSKSFWVWLLLALSSGGLHLTWNSAIFKSIPLQAYNVAIVQPDFFNNSVAWDLSDVNEGVQSAGTMAAMQTVAKTWEYLTTAACIERYSDTVLCGKSVVVVLETETHLPLQNGSFANTSLVAIETRDAMIDGQQQWLCSSFDSHWCGVGSTLPNPTDFNVGWGGEPTNSSLFYPASPYSGRAAYCLSEGIANKTDRCGLQFSTLLLVIVCVLNVLKCLGIFYVCRQNQETGEVEQKLITLGDTIASYLEQRDASLNTGMTNYDDLDKPGTEEARPWLPVRYRWCSAASRGQWIAVIVPCAVTILAMSFLCNRGFTTFHEKVAHQGNTHLIWGTGFGEVDIRMLADIKGVDKFFSIVFFANFWQLIVAMLYVLYNTLLSCLSVSREWERYLLNRLPLRTSSPRGDQHSSYFLSIPFRYSIPLLIACGLLHWFISQSIFLVYTRLYDCTGAAIPNIENHRQSILGFSFIAGITSFIFSFVFMVSLGALAWYRPFDGRMPLAGSNSRAIASACYRPDDDVNAHLLPVQYGAVEEVEAGVLHCSFTTASDVQPPEANKMYF